MIIVLTLGRSGSSLLMQTLDLLGCSVVGRRFDDHHDPARARLHRDLNPGGYYEEPEIYLGGPITDAFQQWWLHHDRQAACKMDLRHFADPAQFETWLKLLPSLSALLISFREPSEQAHSEYLASGLPQASGSRRERFVFTTNFLGEYCRNYGMVANIAEGPLSALASKVHPIDYTEARNAAAYVARICGACGLLPDDAQRRQAIANIDPSLFRVRVDELDVDERNWASATGASQAYDALRAMRDSH